MVAVRQLCRLVLSAALTCCSATLGSVIYLIQTAAYEEDQPTAAALCFPDDCEGTGKSTGALPQGQRHPK